MNDGDRDIPDSKEAIMEQEQPPRDGAVCRMCGASFETQEELDRHVQSEHGDAEEAPQPSAG
jgi:hypothetical protein